MGLKVRFSKQAFCEELLRLAAVLEARQVFSPGRGWEQLTAGRPEDVGPLRPLYASEAAASDEALERCMAYGRCKALEYALDAAGVPPERALEGFPPLPPTAPGVKPRFSRAVLQHDMRVLLRDLWAQSGFTRQTGTAQLWRERFPSAATVALIDRAVEYGRWLELRRLAQAVADGELGFAVAAAEES